MQLVTSAPRPTARLRCAGTFTCVPGNATGPTPPALPCLRATQRNDEPIHSDTGVPGAEKGASNVGAAGIMQGIWATSVDDLHSPTYRNYSMFHTNTTQSAAPEWDTVRPARADQARALSLTRTLIGSLTLALTLTFHPNQVCMAGGQRRLVCHANPNPNPNPNQGLEPTLTKGSNPRLAEDPGQVCYSRVRASPWTGAVQGRAALQRHDLGRLLVG